MALIVGAKEFDRLFLGVQFSEVDGDILFVNAPDEDRAAEMEDIGVSAASSRLCPAHFRHLEIASIPYFRLDLNSVSFTKADWLGKGAASLESFNKENNSVHMDSIATGIR
jgi:hypothetical protein